MQSPFFSQAALGPGLPGSRMGHAARAGGRHCTWAAAPPHSHTRPIHDLLGTISHSPPRANHGAARHGRRLHCEDCIACADRRRLVCQACPALFVPVVFCNLIALKYGGAHDVAMTTSTTRPDLHIHETAATAATAAAAQRQMLQSHSHVEDPLQARCSILSSRRHPIRALGTADSGALKGQGAPSI
ncbi:hypothetical protein T440DRAFT_170794 [Plenodomus tracheiphilus IPT5]|uniref:Uncharacterized protein n=1 Tax=Plenodomus tracheiphilus IPT5 TaxID=1408161 RepID=A0A6A7AZ89_9PLEO|nr:hypothetical protein T440DRAFT_170794 [Plenodomus tracheiphilus IPT5]